MADIDIAPAGVADAAESDDADDSDDAEDADVEEDSEDEDDIDGAAARKQDGPFVLVVTENGFGKRTPLDQYKVMRKGRKGVIGMKFRADAKDRVCCMRICRPGDEVVLSTARGAVIRQSLDGVSVQSRTARGVTIQRIDKDDAIVMVDVLPPSLTLDSVSHEGAQSS
jgi:DNA gyrase subunit A